MKFFFISSMNLGVAFNFSIIRIISIYLDTLFTHNVLFQIIEKFQSGNYNTLVSTCVGEEGLDIGDVDLIVCFDSHKSPIRLVQRMGRTGRKRDGKVVMLVTEGKEEKVVFFFDDM